MSGANPNKKEYIFTSARWHWNLADGPGPLLDFCWKLKRVNAADAIYDIQNETFLLCVYDFRVVQTKFKTFNKHIMQNAYPVNDAWLINTLLASQKLAGRFKVGWSSNSTIKLVTTVNYILIFQQWIVLRAKQ